MTNSNFKGWRKMGITVKCLFIVFSMSAQSYITTVDGSAVFFSTTENQKIEKIESNDTYEQIWIITLGDLSAAETDGELILDLPGVSEGIMAFRKSLEVEASDNFRWEGEIDDEGSVFFNKTPNGFFGRITLEQDIYLIEAINEDYSLLMKMDTSVYTPEECGTPAPNPPGSFHLPDNEGNEKNHCENLPIRVGVMFTVNAENTGLNMENIAMTAIRDLNRILDNSDVHPHDAWFTLAGVRLLENFNEGINACADAVTIRANPAVQAFRDDPGVLADVVVLLTAGEEYGNTLGCVGDADAIGAAPEDAFAIVQAEEANGRFTFAHEVIHLIGGRHQQCDVWDFCDDFENPPGCISGCDDTEGFEHGWGWEYRTWFLGSTRRRTTLMHQLRNGYTRLQQLSNPDIDGREDLNDNARMMRLNACDVGGFAVANPMTVSFSEKPSYNMPLYSSGTWCVEVENCTNPSISWAYSTDGWN